MPFLVRYHFNQPFHVPAQKAFNWCTSFDIKDNLLMGEKNAERQIIHLAHCSIIIKDTFHTPTGSIEKQKLVKLYYGKLTWTSTHLTGPTKHSQFLYQNTPKGKDASVLNFTALHLEYAEKAKGESLAKQLCREDAAAWKLLAKAIEEEYGLRRKRDC